MNQREAKRLAWWLAAKAVQASIDVGWPFATDDLGRPEFSGLVFEDEDGKLTDDGNHLGAALKDVVAHMETKGHR